MHTGGAMDTGFARKLMMTRLLRADELDVYRAQREAFERKFGREMGPDDPFFFDPESDTPEFRAPQDADFALTVIARLLGEVGIEPAAIYAFKKTRGLFPTSRTPLTPPQMQEWDAAVLEYQSMLARTATQ